MMENQIVISGEASSKVDFEAGQLYLVKRNYDQCTRAEVVIGHRRYMADGDDKAVLYLRSGAWDRLSAVTLIRKLPNKITIG